MKQIWKIMQQMEGNAHRGNNSGALSAILSKVWLCADQQLNVCGGRIKTVLCRS